MVNIGQIGAGAWGQNHIRVLLNLENCFLKACCDTDIKALEKISSAYGDKIKSTGNPRDIFDDKNIDAVVIAAPAATHAALAIEALSCGKHVFVEKPLALNVGDGERIIETARKNKRILMVGHLLLYHPAIIKLKEVISRGDLGKIRYIYSNRLNIGKLRTEENILWSFAPHDISVILMLLEEEPLNVSAFGGDYVNAGINDVTLTNLEFKNGVKGHIFVSWLHPYKEHKLVVVGSKAMAVFDDLTKEKLFLYPHIIKWKDGKIPVAQKADFKIIPVENAEPLKSELGHFVDCIVSDKTPRTDGLEGLRVLRVLEGAEKTLINKGKTAPINPGNAHQRIQVHETACIDDDVLIGDGTAIWHFSHILRGSSIGKNCKIGQNVVIGPDVKIGNNVKIQNNVSVYPGVTLEDDVFCGPSMVFTNIINPRSAYPRNSEEFYKKPFTQNFLKGICRKLQIIIIKPSPMPDLNPR